MRCPKCRVVMTTGNGGLMCFKCGYTLKTQDLRMGNKFYKDRKKCKNNGEI